jgi:hypothetical protein
MGQKSATVARSYRPPAENVVVVAEAEAVAVVVKVVEADAVAKAENVLPNKSPTE